MRLRVGHKVYVDYKGSIRTGEVVSRGVNVTSDVAYDVCWVRLDDHDGGAVEFHEDAVTITTEQAIASKLEVMRLGTRQEHTIDIRHFGKMELALHVVGWKDYGYDVTMIDDNTLKLTPKANG